MPTLPLTLPIYHCPHVDLGPVFLEQGLVYTPHILWVTHCFLFISLGLSVMYVMMHVCHMNFFAHHCAIQSLPMPSIQAVQ